MCRLRNIAMRDYQESVTTGQTHTRTDGKIDRQTPDKVIPMCRYASQATKKHDLKFLYHVYVLRADRKPKMATMASD